ncbi:FMN-binding negative transcriptional regulator [Undibacterium sp.]|jgi:transcriptional regulator|uniref:FMN-binding negative transcriptional regulator n=1 Tax=Undibacterium sp. TaxID=1914977 RepID=UPI002CDBB830|nr:FMN-binding negative transcriptional regulator [Undibacterium sp.]HTD04804.1 FMN-binding negative transcriptional regulator [Undibacterium sp.]
MYIPAHFAEERLEVLHQLIHTHPLGTLVTLDADGLNANHIPFEIAAPTADAPHGILRAHVARNNPVWKTASREVDSLVVFQGAQHYISPGWYEEKEISGKVVPTYNYATVHAHGLLRVIDDPVWLRALVERLTRRHEAIRQTPWQVGDAPADYIEKMLGAIIGIEIPVTRLAGKWKASQNRSEADRLKVVQELNELNQLKPDSNAAGMARLVAGDTSDQ